MSSVPPKTSFSTIHLSASTLSVFLYRPSKTQKDLSVAPLISNTSLIMNGDASKLNHTVTRDTQYDGHSSDNANAGLSRQVTVSMSPDQYERLFFSPTGAQKGDYAKRFGNPTLLGLLSFLVPYTSTIFILLGWGGSQPPASLIGLTGDYYFFGAIGMTLAGVAEFILGNTFPFAVFIIFGIHWGSLSYVQDPIHQIPTAFAGEGGAAGALYNSSQAWHNVTMAILCFILLIGTLRVNIPFVLVFIGLVGLFS